MISALDRLRALRAGSRSGHPALTDIDDLPMCWRIDFEERAAILEYEGGLTRENAEMNAFDEIQRRMKQIDCME